MYVYITNRFEIMTKSTNTNMINRKYSIIEITMFVFVILLMLSCLNRLFLGKKEAMTTREKFSQYFPTSFVVKKDKSIYDDFYAKVYDNIFVDKNKFKLEVAKIIENGYIDNDAEVLDIGSGNGYYVQALNNLNCKSVIGIDNSKSMVTKSRKMFPKLDIRHEDANNAMLFSHDMFTHILMMNFTLYYFKDIQHVMSNVYKWLKPGGYFIAHIVNREKFDPIIKASNPIKHLPVQKYANKRITSSKIYFDVFEYNADYKFLQDSTDVLLEEEFKHQNGKVRKNQHRLNILDIQTILSISKQIGFHVKKRIDMNFCNYEYQYLYFFQKA